MYVTVAAVPLAQESGLKNVIGVTVEAAFHIESFTITPTYSIDGNGEPQVEKMVQIHFRMIHSPPFYQETTDIITRLEQSAKGKVPLHILDSIENFVIEGQSKGYPRGYPLLWPYAELYHSEAKFLTITACGSRMGRPTLIAVAHSSGP
ncbi:hypothetical protein [Paenibacillus prosopidis]|uniref:Uncharacterized protein n=1 Tax=Paenibacillus prosopidis TaxID=630520 RepID=A0A368VN08_9BACL|nr:hypothetical protein [Paenibacillus prosopidis]RCW42385.1 hypothetical protein DFP97_117109 [Paenibacillus prosopidis]